ncbi:hypothetical protein NGF19_16500 [Streptomyces sp. RY43-2]|uniref:Uncharacterized protein n=1 Tax=Streptomyces macrolidinus TaxID=2952607 RepID=A0ABT0ZFM2_9ACTN|nr:hypothetical protein [Streptomyces macrolidinus]MCN9242373.1 hypothetical protein [Streptomyces macrolidinus]
MLHPASADGMPCPTGSVLVVNLHLINDVPDGLTRRAQRFVGVHGIKVDTRSVEQHRQWWLEQDIPAAVIDRMVICQEQWPGHQGHRR